MSEALTGARPLWPSPGREGGWTGNRESIRPVHTNVLIRRKQIIDKYLGYFLIGLLLPFTRLLGITLRLDHGLSKPPKRILFIKLMGLGSLVAASDAIAGMKTRLPDTRFILLTDDNIAEGIAPF